MRKLLAIQHCGEVGGSGIGMLAVMNMLKESFEIEICCVSSPDHLVRLYKESGFVVKEVRYIPGFYYHSGGPRIVGLDFIIPLLRLQKAAQEWENVFREAKPDFVLVNSMILGWMWKPIRASEAAAICHVREVLPNRWDPRARRILRDLEHFDAVWFISEHERAYFNLKHPKTAVIRDCLVEAVPNTEDATSKQRSDREFHVLYVGGLSKLKGIYTLLKSVNYVGAHVVVDVAGYVPEHAEFKGKEYAHFGFLKNLILRLKNLSKRKMLRVLHAALAMYTGTINLIGHRNDLSDLYRDCDVLVFPSRKPHQSRPAFEAGFYGKPVIISDFEQTQENVRDGYNGLTFKPNDPKALAEAINRLCNDRDLCRRLGENNRKNSMEKHTSEAVQKLMGEFWSKFRIDDRPSSLPGN